MLSAAAVLCASASGARAESMDLALSRLRIVGGRPGCAGTGTTARQFCPSQAPFERLVSEFAMSMAPPVNTPARGIGPRAFALALDTTVTGIESASPYWSAGTEGAGQNAAAELDANPNPASAMIWNRFQLRSGLPLGFEVGAALAQGLDTSMWTLGLSLKWAVFEGFRTGLGRMPDVALRAELVRSVGSSQATVQLYTTDITLSKPFVIEHAWTLSPLAGLQLVLVDVTSGVIDLTPGGLTPAISNTPDPSLDATNACIPLPGNQPTAALVCTGDSADTVNNVTFDTVAQTRARAFFGAQLGYRMITFAASMQVDLLAPGLVAKAYDGGPRNVARLIAGNLTLGLVL